MNTTKPSTHAARNMLDDYELLAELGSGGMGVVYLARLTGLAGFERLVAIKLVHPHLKRHHESLKLLLDEARLSAKIHHPNVVPITNVCESERGYYVVMDYVEGFALDDLLAHPALDRDTRIRVGVRALVDAAQGLEAAHRLVGSDGKPLDLVHRDVSPQNILVGCDGLARLIDFGVAHAAERLTQTEGGFTRGKPCYMAPEQAMAQPVDARADVFALGAVLWEVLTGRMLFAQEGGIAAVLHRVRFAPIEPPSSVEPTIPKALDEVCLRALERDRDQRTKSAAQFALELEQAAAGHLATSRELSERMTTLFAESLDERRDVIRRGASPRLGSDVFEVPRLSKPHSQASVRAVAWSETPDARGTAALAATAPAVKSAPKTAGAETAAPGPSATPRATHVVLVVLAVAVGIGGAAVWAASRAPSVQTREGAAQPATVPHDVAAPATATTRAPATPEASPLATPAASPSPTAPAQAQAEAAAAATKPPASDAPITKRSSESRAAQVEPSAEPATKQRPAAQPPAPAIKPLKLEQNPYQYSGSTNAP